MLSGAFGILLSLAHPDQLQPGALADPLWIPVHQLGALTAPLQVAGWVGVYTRYRTVLGRVGPIALPVLIAGAIAGAADQLVEASLPARASDAATQTVAQVREPLDAGLWPLLVISLLYVVALVIVAWLLYQRNAPPRAAWLTLLVAFVALPAALFIVGVLVPELVWTLIVASGVVGGAMFVWIGTELGAERPAGSS